METYYVYIKIDDDAHVIAINSSAFLDDTSDWIVVTSGTSDRYKHAQGNYLPKSIIDENGHYNYKYIDNAIVDNDDKEIIEPTISLEERIGDLEAALCEIIESMS